MPTTFGASYGSPQTVEVNAKRSLGEVQAYYQVNGGRTRVLNTREFAGGDRYGKPGVYYHRLRARISGIAPGDKVRTWFSVRAPARVGPVHVHREVRHAATRCC